VSPSETVSVPTMHTGELETDAALVRRLLVAQFPQWAGLRIGAVVPAGTDNAIYRLGDDMCVRLPRLQSKTPPLEKELRWLPKLAPSLPLEVPLPLAVGEPAQGYPFRWSVFRWLGGDTANAERIEDFRRAASDLATFIAALQEVDATGGPPPGEHNGFRGGSLRDRDEPTRGAIASLGGAIDGAAAISAWEAALATPAWEREAVWIHGDLDFRNLVVARGRISAVIDLGCLGVGDPAYDVSVAWKVLPKVGRDVFRQALEVDRATWARARGCALSQALLALSYYTLETNAVLVQEARRWLPEILADDTL
jgi:aminoglycoside phosphotransferase (APT) family kinase protein